MSRPVAYAELARIAARPYRRAGRFAHRFALGKLTLDPIYESMIARGLLGRASTVLDLGCGQGLLAALLLAAGETYRDGRWPAGWPVPPIDATVRGLELMTRDVERARHALGDRASITVGDITRGEFASADIVVIADVLHYLTFDAQIQVLGRVRHALDRGGRLLLRVADAEGGLGFRISQLVDHVVTRCRGHRLPQLYCRPIADWLRLLREMGFSVHASPMSAGTPFANVLLIADSPEQAADTGS
jgi:SAM-dependent methyltransferase